VSKPVIATVEIGGPFKLLAQQIWIKAKDRKAPEMGEAITPTAVQAGSADTGTQALNLINGSGLRDLDFDGLTEHRGDPGFMWRSVKGEAKGWLEFDLGRPQKLGALCVWNHNDTWHTDRGVQKMDVSVWTQEGGWQKIRDDLPVDQAEGGDGYDEPTIVRLDAVTAQKVRFDDLASCGDADYVGLSEVQFFGPQSAQTATPVAGGGQ
jgi:hypothetical protein